MLNLTSFICTHAYKHIWTLALRYLARDSEVDHMLHFMHLALIFNRLDYLSARPWKGSGLGPAAFWNPSLLLSLSLSPSLFLLSPYFFFFLFSIFPSPSPFFLLLVLASSPTHMFSNIRGQNNNSCQVPVCIMIYSHFHVKFDFCRAFANTLFR